MPKLSQALSSSALARAEYDTDSQELIISFLNGTEYTYEGVPQDIYDGLITAPSPGRYFHAMIKDQF